MVEEQSVVTERVPAGEALTPLVAPTTASKYFARRFLVVYTVLGLILVGSFGALLVYGINVGIGGGKSWSRWKPSSGTSAAMAKQIADHLSPNYRLPSGQQIVAVVPSAPTVTAGTDNISIAAVALRSKTGSETNVQTVTSTATQMYTLCGLGNHCSIGTGQPSLQRGQLVHREGLETALYTFKYVPKIESVILFMPPAKGATATTVLYYQKENLAGPLGRPLRETLPLAVPPPSDQADPRESGTIDGLTLPHLFTSALTQLQPGGALLVLTPVLGT